MMELVALGSNPERARDIATEMGGHAYVSDPADDRAMPFRSLIRVSTDDRSLLAGADDIGTYLVFSRQVKTHPVNWASGEPSPGVSAVFGMVGHPDLSHAQSDAHWRDTHAPLALQHHPGMWDYAQLSAVATIDGPEYDGFAICSFASMEDLRTKFFANEEGQKIIRDDVASFADMKRSPRRVLTTEYLTL
jgi:uncharacterized protein (TIGR02118 family)